MAYRNIEGLDQLINMTNQLGQVPRKVARAAARAGGQADLVAVRNAAPVGSTGNLKASLTKKEERGSASNRGKSVFDIRFNPAFNISLVKNVINPGKYGGQNSRAYYPASQEYGFLHSGPRGFVPGYNFMKKASDEDSEAVKKAMIDKAISAIDKILESR
ncbi:HK97 gp10 family phage protein [Pullulanibacillus sp. KACC 23026]|uniref:HK97 gp10 family phage protein n=1 Tax=Pullulanibacillus sp. KACC 23026 TaxID=3028315 RepID=UPI0023B1EAF5|nr:HK97 gp10 family phage protein [Pullulanibacillus sp. KACC 23026]WEG14003.1 HK97 gp10 family phage protein [Pullulanibacillus sp. KACC 23026]